MAFKKIFRNIFLSSIFVLPTIASAQTGDNDAVNKANNPLTPMMGINFHDYYQSEIYGTDDEANQFLLRGILPHNLGGKKQITRITVPYVNLPDSRDNVDGFGDLNLFDIFLLDPINGYELGIGPYFVFPTASKDAAGAGLWQAGLSGTVIKPTSFGLIGSLLTYQHDVAGPSELPTQSILTFQPLFNYHLPRQFYLRSTAIWNFDLDQDHYSIPLGAGLGKVWDLDGGSVVNIFAEPQWTVAHKGEGQPEFQTFIGMNMQFPF
jgi:hypothetical protein